MEQSKKLKPVDFYKTFEPYARKTQEKTGIHKHFILAQAALESGWNSASPGWMFFGVKDRDGVNGNEQLLKTTEYSRRSDLKFPEIISITPVVRNGQKWFKYVIRDYFRKYDSPDACFEDHASLFFRAKRYALALLFKEDAKKFATEVAKAGYATDPNYAEKLHKIINMFEKLEKNL